MAAIKYKQDLYKTSAGEVTPDRIKSALETYQSCVREYGPVEEEGLPLAVNIEKIVPIRPLLKGLSEAFADPLTGIGADLMDIDPNDIDGAYYEKCAEHLQDVMRNEQRENETAQQKALEKYSELDTPFYLHSGISKDAFDYIEFYILFLAILCVATAAPTFAGEYQTGGDSILRTTKYGRNQLAITKILAAFTLFVVAFLVGITVHILILDAAFGTDCLKISFQMLYSIINLPSINLGQLQIILAAVGLISVLATVSCTLLLSAKCKDTLTVLLISIVVLLMPLFAYVEMGATWLSTILPSAGIGMQNNFHYQLANFHQDIISHIQEVHQWRVRLMHSLILVWFLSSFQLPNRQCGAYSQQRCKHQYCCAWECILQILFSSYQISLSLNQSFVAKIRSISISSPCHFYFVLYCFI